MKRIIIVIALVVLFFCGDVYSDNSNNYLIEQKVYEFLEKWTQDDYKKLELAKELIKQVKNQNNKTVTKALNSIIKVLRIEIIKEEAKVHEIVLGQTSNGKDVKAYYKGNPNKEFLLITANIHGGYEYGTYLTAVELKNRFVRSGKKGWMIIETLNPDGLQVYLDSDKSDKYYLEGRANSNGIDLNRNFCTNSFYEFDYKKQDIDLTTGEVCGQENEVKMIEKLLDEYRFSGLVDIHSAGGIIYIPENSFDDKNVIGFTTKVDETLDLRYYFKSDYKDEKEKEGLIKEYEVDSGGEGEFTGTLITYFYEKTGKPAILLELWDHGRVEDIVLNLSKLLE